MHGSYRTCQIGALQSVRITSSPSFRHVHFSCFDSSSCDLSFWPFFNSLIPPPPVCFSVFLSSSVSFVV